MMTDVPRLQNQAPRATLVIVATGAELAESISSMRDSSSFVVDQR
jgi:hypothetical protein